MSRIKYLYGSFVNVFCMYLRMSRVNFQSFFLIEIVCFFAAAAAAVVGDGVRTNDVTK